MRRFGCGAGAEASLIPRDWLELSFQGLLAAHRWSLIWCGKFLPYEFTPVVILTNCFLSEHQTKSFKIKARLAKSNCFPVSSLCVTECPEVTDKCWLEIKTNSNLEHVCVLWATLEQLNTICYVSVRKNCLLVNPCSVFWLGLHLFSDGSTWNSSRPDAGQQKHHWNIYLFIYILFIYSV